MCVCVRVCVVSCRYTYSYDQTQRSGGKGDKYIDFIVDTVVPWVRRCSFSRCSSIAWLLVWFCRSNKRIRVCEQLVRIWVQFVVLRCVVIWLLAVMGSSLGGLISCYAAYKRSAVFQRAGCMSSSFFWNNEDFNNVVIPSVQPRPNIKVNAANAALLLTVSCFGCQLYVDSGDAGPSQDGLARCYRCLWVSVLTCKLCAQAQTVKVRDHLVRDGFVANVSLFFFTDHGGQHSEIYWQRRLFRPMAVSPRPRSAVHCVVCCLLFLGVVSSEPADTSDRRVRAVEACESEISIELCVFGVKNGSLELLGFAYKA